MKLFLWSGGFFFGKFCYISSLKNFSDLDYKVFCQNGEDGIIDYLLFSLDITTPKFIEIGIGNYIESNTRYLFETTNSKGLTPLLYAAHEAKDEIATYLSLRVKNIDQEDASGVTALMIYL